MITGDLLARLVLGHLVGDYLLQNNWMALNKKKEFLPAFVHCTIWTICVMLFTAGSIPGNSLCLAVVCVWISHWFLDYTHFVDWWLHLIHSRSTKRAEEYCSRTDVSQDLKQYMIFYTAFVQTVADNTLHLAFLYIIFNYLVK